MRISIVLAALFAFLPARASATSQSGSLNGAAGNVTGTMTAGFFSGDGSELTHLSTSPYSPVLCTLPNVSLGASCSEPSNVTGQAGSVPASGVLSGTLGNGVNLATVLGLTAQTYGSASAVMSCAVTSSGTLSNCANTSISIPGSSVTSGVAESVNASMVGTGANGSSLGVNPSSVPVYQAGAYPAASGANITSLSPANHSAGTFPVGVYLANSGVSPGTYGSSSQVPVCSVTSSGTISACSNTSIAIAGSAVSGNISGNAAGITGTLNVVQLANGPIASSLFPSTAAFTTSTQTFSGGNSLYGGTTFYNDIDLHAASPFGIFFSSTNGRIAQDINNFYYNPTAFNSAPTLEIGPYGSNPFDAQFEFYCPNAGQCLHVHSNAAQSSTGGPILSLNSTPSGAAMTVGSRLGTLQFGGSQDTIQTIGLGPRIVGRTAQNWTASHQGSILELNTIPNNTTTATNALTLDQNQSAVFYGSATVAGAGGLGVTYGINATTAAFSGGLTAASGTFTNSGASSFSVKTSSGIDMTAGLLQVASQAGNKCASFDANGNLYGTGSSCGSGGGGLSSIQVGTVPATANSIPSSVAISTGAVGFDQNFFAISTNAVVSLSTSGAAHLPTRTTLTSGSGTYTPPSGAVQLKVRMVGGGGGGAAAYPTVASNAGNASDTVFNSVHAAGGLGGANENSGNASGGGAGGTGGSGTASFRAPGGPGGAGPNENGSDGAQMPSNFGGSSLLGGGAYPNGNLTGNNALANTGGGGVGGTGTFGGGGGGGGGEYVELIINNPTTVGYAYSVSTGAAGGTSVGATGGNGGSGVIIIDEYYSPVTFGAQVNSTNTWTAPQAFQAAVQFDSVSISTLLGITPTAVGQMYYCNNCSPLKAVISTGTAAGNFATPDGGQFK